MCDTHYQHLLDNFQSKDELKVGRKALAGLPTGKGRMWLRLPRGFPLPGPAQVTELLRVWDSPAPPHSAPYGFRKLKANSVSMQPDPGDTGRFSLTESSPVTLCLWEKLLSHTGGFLPCKRYNQSP